MTAATEREELREFVRGVAMALPPSYFGSRLAINAMVDAMLAAGYRRAPGWRPIETADKTSGAEILGSRWHNGRMTKEPFISFWSPTLSKFYCDPTHFMPLPSAPR